MNALDLVFGSSSDSSAIVYTRQPNLRSGETLHLASVVSFGCDERNGNECPAVCQALN